VTTAVNDTNKDLYSLNYSFLFSKCEEYARDNPINWQALCVTILEKCIVLPIECENQDAALTIFSTLNDRGLPLSDSDIFKAQIYKMQSSEEKRNEFTNEWKNLTETVDKAGISLDFLFRNYSHVIRARKGDTSKEIGLRKFFTSEKFSKLKDVNLIDDLKSLSVFWLAVNKRESRILDKEFISFEASKYLHCLQCYPNEYWKYITSVFYLHNKDADDFIEIFPVFLEKLTAFLFVRFIEKPTVNAIKDEVYLGGINVLKKIDLFVKNIDEIASRVVEISKSAELRKELGDRGKERARQRFSVEAMINRHQEIYSQAIQILR
jgi:glycosyltransferase involved in cell wall biosynthesis